MVKEEKKERAWIKKDQAGRLAFLITRSPSVSGKIRH
jgi:hypothetical protein